MLTVLHLFNNLRDTETLCSFRLILAGRADKEMPGSSRLEQLWLNNFALSDAKDNLKVVK